MGESNEKQPCDRFLEDSRYRESVVKRQIEEAQKQHQKNLDKADKEAREKERYRKKRIDDINRNRWEYIGYDIWMNTNDGQMKIKQDGREYFVDFENIEGFHEETEVVHDYQQVTHSNNLKRITRGFIGGSIWGKEGAALGMMSAPPTSEIVDRGGEVRYARVQFTSGEYHIIQNVRRGFCKKANKMLDSYDPQKQVFTEDLPEIRQIDEEINALYGKVKEAEDEPLHVVIPDIYLKDGYTYWFEGNQMKFRKDPDVRQTPSVSEHQEVHDDAGSSESKNLTVEDIRKKYNITGTTNKDEYNLIAAYFSHPCSDEYKVVVWKANDQGKGEIVKELTEINSRDIKDAEKNGYEIHKVMSNGIFDETTDIYKEEFLGYALYFVTPEDQAEHEISGFNQTAPSYDDVLQFLTTSESTFADYWKKQQH